MYFKFLHRHFQLLQNVFQIFAKCISNFCKGISNFCKLYIHFLQNVFPIWWVGQITMIGQDPFMQNVFCNFCKGISNFVQNGHPYFAKCVSNMLSWTNHDGWLVSPPHWSGSIFLAPTQIFTPGRWWAGVRKCPTIVHLMTLNTGINIQQKGKLPYILCDVKPELFQWRFSDKEFWLVFQNSVGISTFKHRKNHKSCTSQ